MVRTVAVVSTPSYRIIFEMRLRTSQPTKKIHLFTEVHTKTTNNIAGLFNIRPMT